MTFLILLAILLMFFLPAAALQGLGIDYVLPEGAFYEKIHPASIVVLFAATVGLLSGRANRSHSDYGNPLWSWIFIGSTFLTLVYVGIVHGISGGAAIIDSLLIPGILAIILNWCTADQRKLIFNVLVICLSANCILVIGEAFAQQSLIPQLYETSLFRAAGFLNHPLNAALITLPFTIAALDYKRTIFGLAATLLLFITAFTAFGARASAILAVAGIATVFLIKTLRASLESRISRVGIGAALCFAFALPLAILAAPTTIWARFQRDALWDISAQARTGAIDLFLSLPINHLLRGYELADIMAMIQSANIGAAIENFWLYTLIFDGLLVGSLLCAALLLFVFSLQNGRTIAFRIAALAFVLGLTANNSISSKTPALSFFVVLMICGPACLRVSSARNQRERLPQKAHSQCQSPLIQ